MEHTEDFHSQKPTFSLEEWRLTFMCGMWWSADAIEILLVSFLIPAVASQWSLSNFEKSLIGAVTFAGIFVGGFIWGMIADKYGRKLAYLITTLYTAVTGFVSAMATQLLILLILRFFLGVGLGAAGVAFSLYTEFLSTRNRGLILVLFESFWTFGILLEIGIAWLVLPSLGWRWLLIFSAVPLFCLFFFYPFLLESPRYLLISGRSEEAEKVLQRVAKINRTQLPSGHLNPLRTEPRGKLRDLFSSGLKLLTSLLWIIWFNSSLIYYGIVLFTPEYFGRLSEGKFLSDNVFLFVLIASLAEFPGVILSALIIERLGRKITTAIFFILCGSSLYILVIFTLDPIITLILVMTARMFIEGCYAVLWAYSPEAYPTPIRTTGVGAANSVSKFASIFTPFISTYLSSISMNVPLFIFATLSMIAAICTFFLPLETHQKKLQDTLTEVEKIIDNEDVSQSSSKVEVTVSTNSFEEVTHLTN